MDKAQLIKHLEGIKKAIEESDDQIASSLKTMYNLGVEHCIEAVTLLIGK